MNKIKISVKTKKGKTSIEVDEDINAHDLLNAFEAIMQHLTYTNSAVESAILERAKEINAN